MSDVKPELPIPYVGPYDHLADAIPFTHAQLCDLLNRRAEVEDKLLRAARGIDPMPDAAVLRAWATRLGVPTGWQIYGQEPALPPPSVDEMMKLADEYCASEFNSQDAHDARELLRTYALRTIQEQPVTDDFFLRSSRR